MVQRIVQVTVSVADILTAGLVFEAVAESGEDGLTEDNVVVLP